MINQTFNYGFAFGVHLSYNGGAPLPLDPTMFTLNFKQAGYTFSNGTIKTSSTILGTKLWDDIDLPNVSKEFKAKGFSSSLYCPASNRYKIAGNYLSNNYHVMLIFSISLKIF